MEHKAEKFLSSLKTILESPAILLIEDVES